MYFYLDVIFFFVKKNRKFMLWLIFFGSHIFAIGTFYYTKYGMINFRMEKTNDKMFDHIIFMPIFIIFTTGGGMCMFRLFPKVPVAYMKYVHGFIHTICLLGAFWAGKRGYDNREDTLKEHPEHSDSLEFPHWANIHAKFGLITLIVYALFHLASFVAFIYRDTTPEERKKFAGIHSFIGFGLFVFIVAEALSGVEEFLLDSIYQKMQNPTAETNYEVFSRLQVKTYLYAYFIVMFCILLNPFFEWPEVGEL